MAANNTYLIDVLAVSGAPTAADSGGIDWLEFSPSFAGAGEIYLGGWVSTSDFNPPTCFAYADYQNHQKAAYITGIIENARGGNGADKVVGNEFNNILFGDHAATGAGGKDSLFGLAGNDKLYGGAAGDSLNGGKGNDTLVGRAGADTLIGGAGADNFVFSAASQSVRAVTGRDTISDFHHAEGDKIDLRGIDAKSATPTVNDAFTLVGSAALGAGKLRIADAGADVLVYGDLNGDQIADFALLVKNVATLVVGDFML